MARKSRKKNKIVAEEPLAPIYRVGIYCRLSVENHEDMEDNSLGNQEKTCLAYLANQPDMEYSQTYNDNGKTGTNFERPAFKRMLDDIHRGFINCVIVKDLSRFGRNFIDTSLYLDRRFPEWGVRFIAVNNDFDTLYARSEEGGYDISIPFYNILSEYYAHDVSRKIKAVFHSKMENGTFIPGAIPMGYLPDKEHNTYQIDPVGAEAVQYIFQRTAEGVGYSQIARELNDMGLPTPFRRKIQLGMIESESPLKRTEQWRYDAVKFILHNPAYSGKRVHYKRENDPDKLIEVPDAHPQLVDADLYEKALQMDAAYIQRTKTGFMNDDSLPPINYRTTIADRIYCGMCKKKVGFDGQADNLKFKCRSKCHPSINGEKTGGMSMIAQKVTAVLMAVLLKQAEAVGDMEALLSDIENEVKASGHYKYMVRKKKSLKMRIDSAENYLSQLPYRLVDGCITKEEYPLLKKKYQDRISELQAEQAEFDVEYEACMKPITLAKEMIESLRRFHDSNDVDESLLSLMVKKITLYPDRRIEIELNYQDIYEGLWVLANGGHDDEAE